MPQHHFTDQHRKQLQRLMSDPMWASFEAFFADFMFRHFVETSIKRQTEFDTMWYAAEDEGAKRKLSLFVQEMEQEAGRVDVIN